MPRVGVLPHCNARMPLASCHGITEGSTHVDVVPLAIVEHGLVAKQATSVVKTIHVPRDIHFGSTSSAFCMASMQIVMTQGLTCMRLKPSK